MASGEAPSTELGRINRQEEVGEAMSMIERPSATSPPIESAEDTLHEPAPRGLRWLSLVWRSYDGQQRSKRLFLVRPTGSDTTGVRIAFWAIAPNGTYYYWADVTGTYLGRVGQPRPRKVFSTPYQCLFSPNSRFLCGLDDMKNVFRILECATGRGRIFLSPQPKIKRYYFLFGWYPDSTHIWYREEVRQAPGEPELERFYKLNVLTLRRQRLTEAERKRLFQDWAMLDPRFRHGWRKMDGDRMFAYSPNQQWRVRVEPFYDLLDHYQRGREELANMYLEAKKGGTRLLLSHKDHSYFEVIPLDVTDDGRWVLFAGNRSEPYEHPDIQRDNGKRSFSEVVVVDTQTLRRHVYFDTRVEGQFTTAIPPLNYGWRPFWFSRIWDKLKP